MQLLTEQEAKKIIDTVLAHATADETSVAINGSRTGNIRFAQNMVTTSGERENLTLTITTYFGKRSGSVTINELNDAAIKSAVQQAEEVARLAPENSEHLPLLGPQQYAKAANYSEKTAAITPTFRATLAWASIKPCREAKVDGSGYLEDTTGFIAIGNSRGLFGYNKATSIELTTTVRTADGRGSGFAVQSFTDASKVNSKAATTLAMQKAKASASAIELPPGKYTVILEPAALAGNGDSSFLSNFMAALDARNADEGRSFFGNRGGGNKVGEKLFSDLLTIYSDPTHPEVPTLPFAPDGRPQEKVMWVEKGVLKNLVYSRFWADKQGVKAVPAPGGVIVAGGTKSLEEMIRESDNTILVTRTWYMRPLNQQSLLVTGLTRDGVFFIENGAIKHAVKNFRFNESPLQIFRNLEVVGRPVRIGNNLVPPVKTKDFNFSSLSDAV
ncbi:TldD/PmbA family protein [Pseudocnuella soli]|uniref:TldD/PmbA family protein n=1 Tax=Pseudocnuella soli TaxID=2502779 RepID=UPI001050F2F3|nr:TldD/PmbA family protein [Pseudocnuella soli]